MNCLSTAKILFPAKNVDIFNWSVVACDQYTSQPEYWEEVANLVKNTPSTFYVTLPEIYLEDEDVAQKIESINHNMKQYIQDGTLVNLPEGIVLVDRSFNKEHSRRGLVMCIDLECYDYGVGSSSPIRPTEKTIVERIPPRLAVRQNADLELPHVMLLIDDPACQIIEPLFDKTDEFTTIYDTKLMQNGGHIKGYLVTKGQATEEIINNLNTLFDEKTFSEKYSIECGKYPVLPFAVGDGNHSLATAKAHWVNVKKGLSADQIETHPARFCLVEIVNIHDKSLEIEPIHRVMFDTNAEDLIMYARDFYVKNGSPVKIYDECPCDLENAHSFTFYVKDVKRVLVVKNPKWSIPMATLQAFLDDYLAFNSKSKIDYIHGDDVIQTLCQKDDTIGFILPDLEKGDLFKGVILDDVLPRKTFSMGEAQEKRYYMETRKITY